MPSDLAKTDLVIKLFKTPRPARNDAWRAAFFEAIPNAALMSTPSQAMRGPDGFTYFILTQPEPGKPFEPICLAEILEHCTDRGYGIVINPGSDGPEWVFSYGDLFSMRAYGTFDGDPEDREEPKGPAIEVLKENTQVMVGAPNDSMLPSWARRVLATFLKSAGNVQEPRVLVMIEPSRQPSRNLVFNVHPEDFPSQADFKRVLNALGWFMPARRSLVAMSRDSGVADSFVPL